MKIKPSILIVIVVLIILVVLAIIFIGPRKPSPSPGGAEETAIADNILGISGTVENVGQNSLTLNAIILLQDPSKDPIKKSIEVSVDSETKIYRLEFPDPKTLTQEQIENGVQPKETKLSLSDLKKGNIVDIMTEGNISENIKNNTSFTASVINVVD